MLKLYIEYGGYIMNKKRIIKYIIITLIFILLIVCFIILKNIRNKKIIEEVTPLYNKVHELYQFGGDIAYVKNEDGGRNYIEKDGIKYYQISNFDDSIAKYFTSSNLKNVVEFMNIINENGNYYIKDRGMGIGNYFGVTFKVKKSSSNKRTLIAASKFCKIEYQVTYGDLCSGDNEYTIEKEFKLVKENKIWKIDSFTSVFQMGDEIK